MRLRNELHAQLGVVSDIRPGWPTQFVVLADGQVIFSRRAERRLPKPGEIAERLQTALVARS